MGPDELLRSAADWTRQQMSTSTGHDWGHIERVVTNAERLARAEEADVLVVKLAATMHDVVNLPKDHKDRHLASTMSAEKAAGWLGDKISAERIEGVYEAVKCHSYSAGFVPQSLEAKVVSDADNLDAIGAIGIARAFECSGELGRITVASDDPFCDVRKPDDGVYGVDHFYTKLLGLGDRFYTESGRQEATQRLEFMRTYLDEMAREIIPG